MSQFGNLLYRHAIMLSPILGKTDKKPREAKNSCKKDKHKEELAKIKATYEANKRLALSEFTYNLRADKELWKLIMNNFSTLRELLDFIRESGKV